MKRLGLYVFILSTVLFVGCKERYCPGFPDELTDILPYEKGQTIDFVDENGSKVSWEVFEVYKQPAYEYSSCEKCACDTEPRFFIKMKAGKDSIYGRDTILKVTIWSYTMVDKVLVGSQIFYAHYYHADLECNQTFGKNAVDTILLTLATDYSFYDSLVVVRGFGLVGYSTKDGHCFRHLE